MNQLVLVFESDLLNQVGHFQGYSHNVDNYLPILLDPANNKYMDRDQAEQDPTYKQIIPYIILRYQDTVFSYVRGKASSESRLIAKRSIGLGGHIEPADRNLFASDRDAYLQAAKREVDEEVALDTIWVERVVAVLNDEHSAVGKVHFGIVHLWDVAEPHVKKREGLITQSGFFPIENSDNNGMNWRGGLNWLFKPFNILPFLPIPVFQIFVRCIRRSRWINSCFPYSLIKSVAAVENFPSIIESDLARARLPCEDPSYREMPGQGNYADDMSGMQNRVYPENCPNPSCWIPPHAI